MTFRKDVGSFEDGNAWLLASWMVECEYSDGRGEELACVGACMLMVWHGPR